MTVLEGKGVVKRFGGRHAVDHVDFHVDEGEILGLIGPNGAGKTTLFNLISGAIQLDEGTITYNGEKISGLKPHQICHMGIGRTFQAAKNFPGLTVRENVIMGATFGKERISAEEAGKIADEVLEFVGLTGWADKSLKDITLANQKYVEVARALATRPKLLLLDEMMAGLNLTEVSDAMALVTRIRDSGITVVMIEHVMKAIMSVCDRLVVLHHGQKIAEGTPAEVSSNQTVIEVYLGE